jgi:hypothetical protein
MEELLPHRSLVEADRHNQTAKGPVFEGIQQPTRNLAPCSLPNAQVGGAFLTLFDFLRRSFELLMIFRSMCLLGKVKR